MILCFFIGSLLGIGTTLFFTSKAIARAEIEAQENADIIKRLIHEGNYLVGDAWKGE